jgi:hypothetical protein
MPWLAVGFATVVCLHDMRAVFIAEAPPRIEQQALLLTRWRAMRTLDANDVHLVGFHEDGRRGRVSSPVCTLSLASRTATTSSGRLYVLEGPAGAYLEAELMWTAWCVRHGVVDWVDITDELWPGRSGEGVSAD